MWTGAVGCGESGKMLGRTDELALRVVHDGYVVYGEEGERVSGS